MQNYNSQGGNMAGQPYRQDQDRRQKISITLPEAQIDWLNREMQEQGKSRSELICEAVTRFRASYALEPQEAATSCG